MKRLILTLGLLYTSQALSTNLLMLGHSEENTSTETAAPTINANSKAARFEAAFPELKEQQQQIVGEFSIYYGTKMSILQHRKIPALESKISKETDENTKFFLNLQMDNLEKKIPKYKMLSESIFELPKLYTFLLTEIESDPNLNFISIHSNIGREKTLKCFDINTYEDMPYNDYSLDSKFFEAGLKDCVVALNKFSNLAYKAIYDYSQDFLKDYKSTNELANLFYGETGLSITEEGIKVFKNKNAKYLRGKLTKNREKQDQLKSIFNLLSDYFINPLQQFKTLLIREDYTPLTDEKFDERLAELHDNSYNDVDEM